MTTPSAPQAAQPAPRRVSLLVASQLWRVADRVRTDPGVLSHIVDHQRGRIIVTLKDAADTIAVGRLAAIPGATLSTEAPEPESEVPVIRYKRVPPDGTYAFTLDEVHVDGVRVGYIGFRDEERLSPQARLEAVRAVVEQWAGVGGDNPRFEHDTITAALGAARWFGRENSYRGRPVAVPRAVIDSIAASLSRAHTRPSASATWLPTR